MSEAVVYLAAAVVGLVPFVAIIIAKARVGWSWFRDEEED